VVYAPTGEGFFCAEPVSHLTDAFNSGEDAGVIMLQAGDEVTANVGFAPHML